jgi:hypothetical protein
MTVSSKNPKNVELKGLRNSMLAIFDVLQADVIVEWDDYVAAFENFASQAAMFRDRN